MQDARSACISRRKGHNGSRTSPVLPDTETSLHDGHETRGNNIDGVVLQRSRCAISRQQYVKSQEERTYHCGTDLQWATRSVTCVCANGWRNMARCSARVKVNSGAALVLGLLALAG